MQLLGGDRGRALTVRAVCREAALTERYFYESFSDRDEFVRAVYDDVCLRAMNTLTWAKTPREAVERFVEQGCSPPTSTDDWGPRASSSSTTASTRCSLPRPPMCRRGTWGKRSSGIPSGPFMANLTTRAFRKNRRLRHAAPGGNLMLPADTDTVSATHRYP